MLHNKNRLNTLLAFCLLLGVSTTTWALKSDRSKPIKVEADKASINKKTGVSTYTGHVLVQQGSLRITANKLTIHTRDGKLSKMVATGKPATFQQNIENQKQPVRASARKLTYSAKQGTTVFEQDARLQQGENTFSSNRIVYNIHKNRVDAGKKSGGDRVTITIQPESAPSPQGQNKP